jgi:hypothetical protein
MVLGVVFVVGLFIYYMFSTSGGGKDKPPTPKEPPRKDDVQEEGNVIYLTDDINEMKKNHRITR